MKIFIVEDDETIKNTLKEKLEQWDFVVEVSKDLKNILNEVRKFSPHLILMDLNLTYKNGFYWTKEIRKELTTPIIFISSQDENMNIVMAIQEGADDYLVKPIDINILLAKINALLRRTYEFTTKIDKLELGGLTIDLSKSLVEYMGKKEELTVTEKIILETIVRQKGNIATREEIMEKCWSGDDFIDDNTLAVNMTRIRKKLKAIGIDNYILTKKGSGYYINEENL